MRSHVKKADLKVDHIYFWEPQKNLGHTYPALDTRVALANAIWQMRGDELTRVQFKELIEAVIAGDAAELAIVKSRTLDPGEGVSFTPTKKPRYSDGWDFPDIEILPPLEEVPEDQDIKDSQIHIAKQWKNVVQSVETLKTVAGRNTRYEAEMENLGNDIDSIRSALARIQNLVGSPTDGIAFDLFAIVDRNEEALLDLDTIVHTNVNPKMTEVEAKMIKTQADLAKFKASTGDKLLMRLGEMESQIRSLESSSSPDALSGIVVQIRTSLVKEIFPAIRDLWGLFEVLTVGPTGSSSPGGEHTHGAAILSRLASLESTGRKVITRVESLETTGPPVGGNSASLIGISQRVGQLERHLTSVGGGVGATGGRDDLPGLFSQNTIREPAPVWFTPGLGGHPPPLADPATGPRLATLEAKVTDLEA
jgi:hypothetical protein